jgi:hypothetical protein
MVQAAEARASHNTMRRWESMSSQRRTACPFVRKSGAERGMRSFTVVVGHPLRQDSPEMLLGERNHPIETLAPGRPNEAFAVSVRLGRPHHRFKHL